MNRQKKDKWTAFLFLSPALLLFLIFMAFPVIAVFVLSFTKYNIISPMEFAGLSNYEKLWNDPLAGNAYWATIKLVALIVPLHVIVGLLLALGVTRNISKGLKYFYRTIFYFPVLMTTSAAAVAWLYLYSTDFGAINYALSKVGFDKIPWLTSASWVFIAVAIFSVWKFVGQAFIYYLVGLQNMPKDIAEAAEIDGTNRLQKFYYITLPMLSPTVFFVVVILLVSAVQIFEEPYIITQGGPGSATLTVNLYIYQLAYQFQNFGYAATLAFSLFVFVLCATITVFKLGQRFVNYDQL